MSLKGSCGKEGLGLLGGGGDKEAKPTRSPQDLGGHALEGH